jgi:hypothetical protein
MVAFTNYEITEAEIGEEGVAAIAKDVEQRYSTHYVRWAFRMYS